MLEIQAKTRQDGTARDKTGPDRSDLADVRERRGKEIEGFSSRHAEETWRRVERMSHMWKTLKIQLQGVARRQGGSIYYLYWIRGTHNARFDQHAGKWLFFLLTDSGRAEKACSGSATTAWKRKLQAEPATRRPWATAKNGSTAGLLRGEPGGGPMSCCSLACRTRAG